MKRRQVFASTLILLWLLAAGSYLYSLEAPRWRPFISSDSVPSGLVGGDLAHGDSVRGELARSDLAQFDGAAVRRITDAWQTPGRIAIVHFYDAYCACSTATLQHIKDLRQHYGAQVDQYFFSSDLPAATLSLTAQLPAAPAALNAAWDRSIPSSPAVAVWDQHGALAYFGPYSSGPICGTGKDFVSVTLDALMRGENPGLINTTAVGCFCPWRRNKSLGA